MGKKLLLGLLSFAALASSCQKELESPSFVADGELVALKATFEGENPATRATETNSAFAWEQGDEITVFTSGAMAKFSANAAGASTTFLGGLNNGTTLNKYAVYPFDESHELDGDQLTVNLPVSYKHSATVKSPMYATLGNTLSFKHVGGVFKFVLDNVPVGATKFVFETKAGITGKFALNSEKYIDVAESGEDNGTVTVTFAKLTEENDGMVVYVPLPVGTLPGFDISIYDAENERVAYNSVVQSVVVKRAGLGIIPVSFTSLDAGFEKEVEVKEGETATDVLASAVESVTENPKIQLTTPATQGEVTIPTAFTSESTNESVLNINYTAVPESIKVIETDADNKDSADSKGEVNVLIPSAETSSVDAVIINTPNLTASVQAKGTETLTIASMEAETANNTLVIGKNVVVESLKVNGGNVIVEMGGKVNKLTVKENIGTIYVYDENSTSIATGTGYIVVESKEELALRTVMANGGEYTLNAEMEVSSPLVLDNKDANVILNLNGYKISNRTVYTASETAYKGDADVFYVSAGTLTINGEGTVEAQAATVKDYAMAVFADEDGHVIINGGTFVNSIADDSKGQLDLIYARKNAVIDINGGTFESKSSDKWVLNVKDKTSDITGAKAAINVYGGTFKGYNPSASETENPIADFVKSGLVVETAKYMFEVLPEKEGVVTLTKNLTVYSQINILRNLTLDLGEYSITAANDATIWNSAAKTWSMLSVQAGKVTIKGTGSVAAKENDSYAVDVRNGAELTVEGGKYNGNITCLYVHTGSLVIKGGEFKIQQLSTNYNDYRYLVNCLDESNEDNTATVSATGGSFHNYDPANSSSENPVANFVEKGYKSVEENGVWTIVTE